MGRIHGVFDAAKSDLVSDGLKPPTSSSSPEFGATTSKKCAKDPGGDDCILGWWGVNPRKGSIEQTGGVLEEMSRG